MLHLLVAALLTTAPAFTSPMRPPAAPVMAGSPLLLQTVSNPSTVTFGSPDHNATQNGQPVVTRYDFELWSSDDTKVIATLSMGKPTSSTTTVTYSQLATLLAGQPFGSYVSHVAAVGPGGTARSVASNPFSLDPRSPAAPGAPVVK